MVNEKISGMVLEDIWTVRLKRNKQTTNLKRAHFKKPKVENAWWKYENQTNLSESRQIIGKVYMCRSFFESFRTISSSRKRATWLAAKTMRHAGHTDPHEESCCRLSSFIKQIAAKVAPGRALISSWILVVAVFCQFFKPVFRDLQTSMMRYFNFTGIQTFDSIHASCEW